MMKKLNKVRIIILIFLLIVAGVLLYSSLDFVPPASMTFGSMHMIKRRVLRYANLYNKLPGNLKELPEIEGYRNSIRDGWGREIIYIVNKNNSITLTSYGKDGFKGGDGNDIDMIGIFQAKDKDNNWQRELCDWAKDPSSDYIKLVNDKRKKLFPKESREGRN